jgi:hypothetical protein
MGFKIDVFPLNKGTGKARLVHTFLRDNDEQGTRGGYQGLCGPLQVN